MTEMASKVIGGAVIANYRSWKFSIAVLFVDRSKISLGSIS